MIRESCIQSLLQLISIRLYPSTWIPRPGSLNVDPSVRIPPLGSICSDHSARISPLESLHSDPCMQDTFALVCKIPLLARRTRPVGQARRATIGYIVFNLCSCDALGQARRSTIRYLVYNSDLSAWIPQIGAIRSDPSTHILPLGTHYSDSFARIHTHGSLCSVPSTDPPLGSLLLSLGSDPSARISPLESLHSDHSTRIPPLDSLGSDA